MTFQELKDFFYYVDHPLFISLKVSEIHVHFCDVHRKRVLMRTGRQIASGFEPSSLAVAL